MSCVLAIRRSDTFTTSAGEQRADALIAAAPARAWQRLSAGAGAHGPRAGRGLWQLARRSLSDPAQIACYGCYGPRRSSAADLAWVAGSHGRQFLRSWPRDAVTGILCRSPERRGAGSMPAARRISAGNGRLTS